MPEFSKEEKAEFLWEGNQFSSVENVIAVASGKGGVGKSLVTSLLACSAAKAGHETAIMDADVTGPSIPKAFGMHGHLDGVEGIGIEPRVSDLGIKVVSMNLLLENEEQPVVWRGPVVAGVLEQFWKDVDWGQVDYMFVDMPPGTGDVPLTVYQSLPVKGIVLVTTPQDLVQMIVKKASTMAQMMNVPILGVIENMSYLTCPDCGKKISVFGESKADLIAKELGIPVLATLPMDPAVATLVDQGKVEYIQEAKADAAFSALEKAVLK
ncbi:MAG TPA: Mrp/NBP35 family ATP-binding protein [Clostridiales bacterium]|nr:Mrp/NBP35 family ATP-binding protein [Clostridiales bacterium]